jgi:hypothetical protein
MLVERSKRLSHIFPIHTHISLARPKRMKYLPLEPLEELNGGLSCIDVGDARIYGRLEAYSCKNTRDDNRLKVHMDAKYDEEPKGNSLEPKSPFGPFEETSRKTLFFLLATLNAAYPDYDFSDVSPSSFCKLPTLSMVANSIHHLLFVPLTNAHAPETGAMESTLWAAIDEALTLDQCDFYAYNPDKDSEPDCEEGGNLWSFYYFFFNKKQKRMLFFTARAVRCVVSFKCTLLLHDSDTL